MSALPYFVFTSGEKGLYGEDWGVKFVSPSLDAKMVDEAYRRAVEAFGLPPSLKRPSNETVGILFLPWNKNENRHVIGFIVPNTDRAGRGNIALVGVFVDGYLDKDGICEKDLVLGIWNSNDVVGIATHAARRPHSLVSENENGHLKPSSSKQLVVPPYFPRLDADRACICIDSAWIEYERRVADQSQLSSDAPKSRLRCGRRLLLCTIAIALAASVVVISVLRSSKKEDLKELNRFESEPRYQVEDYSAQSLDYPTQQKESSSRAFDALKSRFGSFAGLKYIAVGRVDSNATQISDADIKALDVDDCYIEGKKEVSLSLPFNINGLLALPLSMPRELSVFFDRVVIDHEILFVPMNPDEIDGVALAVRDVDLLVSELRQTVLSLGDRSSSKPVMEENVRYGIEELFARVENAEARSLCLFFSQPEGGRLLKTYVFDVDNLSFPEKERALFPSDVLVVDKERFLDRLKITMVNIVPCISRVPHPTKNIVKLTFNPRKNTSNVDLEDVLAYFWEDMLNATCYSSVQ